MAIDEERIQRLSAEYDELKERQDAMLEELRQMQQRMSELMLKILDATRE